MTETIAAPTAPAVAAPGSRALVVLFGLTSFSGAALLFVVQPLVAKLLLPPYGGSATVWSTSSLFFQVLLLLAYLYVHLSSRYLGSRWQPRLHLPLLLLPLVALPVALPVDAAPSADGSAVLWLLRTLALMVGLPFAVLATSGPILQKWFSLTGGHRSEDPYFLFAASNLGSFGGLLAYPFLIEPFLSLQAQRVAWSGGFALFVVLTATCAVAAIRGRRTTDETPTPATRLSGVGARRILTWAGLAFLPASLSLAITAHLSTDVAAIPLLWVVPLAIYLATFVIAFARTTREPPRQATRVAAAATLVVAVLTVLGGMPIWVTVLVDLGLLAAVGLAAHGRLAADRPHHQHLTLYYLVVAAGGALGAVLNGLLAPVAFDRILEFPLTLVLVPLLLVGIDRDRRMRSLLVLLGGLVAIGAVGGVLAAFDALDGVPAVLLLVVLVGGVAWALNRAPLLLGLCVVAPFVWQQVGGSTAVEQSRSFFGAYRVESAGGVHSLVHGTTVHGTQFTDAGRRGEATTYYASPGSVEDVLTGFGDRFRRVGVIGLGAGTLAAYGQPGQELTFFEIDADMVRTARDPALFSYLADSEATVATVVGDGRLGVADRPSGSFDLLVLDAFSSDSIPVHLLTREAMELYADRLAPDGVLAVHISNRYFDLRPVLAATATDLGWDAASGQSVGSDPGSTPSNWVVLSADPEVAQTLDGLPRWSPLPLDRTIRWTDDYSSVLSALRLR